MTSLPGGAAPISRDPDLGPMHARGLGSGPHRFGPIAYAQAIGPFNSGTSLMFSYLSVFGRVTALRHANFWKHSLPPAWHWFAGCRWPAVAGRPSDDLLRSSLMIAMVRNPYFWIVSCSLSGYDIEFVDGRGGGASGRLHSRVRFRGQNFISLASLWNAYYAAYETHLEPHDVRYVRLEDLVTDPRTVMAELGAVLPVERGHRFDHAVEEIRTRPAKLHHPHPGPVGDDAGRLYRVANVRAMLDASDLDRINRELDIGLMDRFGYPLVTAR